MATIAKTLWKIPVAAVALVIGAMAANQAGWSGAEVITSRGSAGFVTDLFFTVGAGISIGAVALTQRLAKPILWVMVPLFLYSALVLGARNSFASDFDATRGVAMKHHLAMLTRWST